MAGEDPHIVRQVTVVPEIRALHVGCVGAKGLLHAKRRLVR